MDIAFAARPALGRSSLHPALIFTVMTAVCAATSAPTLAAPVIFDSTESVQDSILTQYRYDQPPIHEVAMRLAPASYGAIDTIELVLGLTALPLDPPQGWTNGASASPPSIRAVACVYRPSETNASVPGAEIWRSSDVQVYAPVPGATQTAISIPFSNASAVASLPANEQVFLSLRLLDVQGGLFPIVDAEDGLQASFVGYVGPAVSSGTTIGQATMDWCVKLDAGSNWLRQASGRTFGALVTSFVPGDTNGDHEVDIADLAILSTNWQANGATWAMGDFTGDGMVGIADLGLVATNWQSTVEFSAAMDSLSFADVPEPVGVTSLAMLAIVLAGSRNR